MALNAISGTDPRRTAASRPALRRVLTLFAFLCALILPGLAFGQDISIDFGNDATITERAVQLVGLITLLSLAPSILVMVTSFTRIVVVLSLLRTAIGLQTAPPNSVMVSLALFLTIFVMGPTLQQSYDNGIAPLISGQIQVEEAFTRASAPVHDFMAANVRPADLQLFFDMSSTPAPADRTAIPLQVLIPAFMISELRRAFEIGFLLYIPFLIIDIVVANILMTLGMIMVSPVLISIPLKLLLFVAIDGWSRLMHGLILSYS